MPDDPAQFDGLARWLGEDVGDSSSMPSASTPDREQRRGPSLRRGTRAAALVAPWLIVVAVLMAPLRATDPPAPAEPPASAGSPASAEPPAPAEQPTVAAPAPTVPAGAAAMATRLVRDGVTGSHAGETTAVDIAVPEAPRRVGSQIWVVRVHAVVLRGDARRWRSATHEVWAVPVGVHGGRVVGLDHPWRVATEDSRITPGRWKAAAVDETAVRSALRSVGAQPPDDIHAEQHPEIADIIRVRVADGSKTRHVWVRTTPTVEVLGAPATADEPAATERPSP